MFATIKRESTNANTLQILPNTSAATKRVSTNATTLQTLPNMSAATMRESTNVTMRVVSVTNLQTNSVTNAKRLLQKKLLNRNNSIKSCAGEATGLSFFIHLQTIITYLIKNGEIDKSVGETY